METETPPHLSSGTAAASLFRGGDGPTFSFVTGSGQTSEVTMTTANGDRPPGPSRRPQAAVVSRPSALYVSADPGIEPQTEAATFPNG